MVLLLCIQSSADQDTLEVSECGYRISDHAKRFYQERIRLVESEIFNVFEIEPLTGFEIRSLLIEQSAMYDF
jgi:hypothetical protein